MAEEEQPDIKKLTIATLVGVLILGIIIYGAYLYSQKKGANIALPGGTTYLGQNPNPQSQPPTAPLRFTADPTVSWTTYTGKVYPYSFAYPATLPLVYFPGDVNDPVGISWGNITPQANILLNIEDIGRRDPQYISLPKIEYVKNWYKYYPGGLKGVQKVDQFTNTNGLIGYKAVYINAVGAAPNVDIFFEIPGRPNLMVHLANGILDPDIFNRLVDSVKWNPTETKTAQPTSLVTPVPPSPTH